MQKTSAIKQRGDARVMLNIKALERMIFLRPVSTASRFQHRESP